MSLLKSLSSLVTVLETYRGRDRAIRFVTYAAMFMGGNGNTPAQMKWKTVSAEMGACRVILRLFDDLPMLLLNLSRGFGMKEKNAILRPFEVVTGILNQAFYPAEHIAWLRQKKILNGFPTPFLLLGLFIWALSLLTEIIKSLLKLRLLGIQARKLKKQCQLDRDDGQGSSQNAKIKENLKKLADERKDTYLGLIHYCADLTNAISWMPPGILWSQRLQPATNGICGMIATIVMFYRNWT